MIVLPMVLKEVNVGFGETPGMVLLDDYWKALPDDERLHRVGSRNADVPTFRLGDIRALVHRVDAMGEPLSCPPEQVRDLADRLMAVDWDRWVARVCLLALGRYRHLRAEMPLYADRATRCMHAAMTMESFGLVAEALEAVVWAQQAAVSERCGPDGGPKP